MSFRLSRWAMGLGVFTLGVSSLWAGEAIDDLPPLPLPPTQEEILPPPPSAPSQPVAPQPAPSQTPSTPVTPSTPSTPTPSPQPDTGEGVPGEIIGGRVNIRAGSGTKYDRVTTVDTGTKIVIYGSDGEWVKIGYPAGNFCYIGLDTIDGALPAQIPQEGIQRSIRSEEVEVRANPWKGDNIVATLHRDDIVTIVGIRGQWAKILPPPNARAWVFGKYIRYEGQATPIVSPTPEKKEKTKEEAELEATIRAKREQQMAEARAARQAEFKDIDRVIENLREELNRIDQETEARKRMYYENQEKEQEIVIPRTPLPEAFVHGGVSGWIESVGVQGRRPAAFRLIQDQKVLFLLRSSKYDLREYVNRYVAVTGRVEAAPGWEANVLVVERLEPMDQGESPPPPSSERRSQGREITPPLSPSRAEARSPRPIGSEESGGRIPPPIEVIE